MTKMVVNTPHAPEAVGAYSQATVASGLVFCSGQVGTDPRTGELAQGSVEEETAQALENLEAVLNAAGSDFGRVVKVTAYLVDIDDFSAFNDAYAQRFSKERPARATVGVAALPKGARVEIECIAVA